MNPRNILLIIILILSACSNSGREKKRISASSDNEINRAERISIVRKNGYTLVTIFNPWQGASSVVQKYYLVKKGFTIPPGLDSSSVIFVPVNKIICMSTTYIAMISALGMEKTIAGISGGGLIYSPNVKEAYKEGKIVDVGYDANINRELILKTSPDLIMTYGVGSESLGYLSKLMELGVKVILNADYLETDPLGRAEWIKLFGALYCQEILSDSIYIRTEHEYQKIKSLIKYGNYNKPKVLLGFPFKDAWYISPGNSYISNLISDAGGDYIWSETKSSVAIPMGIESVFIKAMSADYWLNIGTVHSRNEISGLDQRLAGLPCYKSGNLFNNTKRISGEGANDYWESGTMNPQILLKDIASILHPGLFGNYEPYYYNKVN